MVDQYTRKRIPLRALTVSMDDVKRVVERLLCHVGEEGDREAALLKRPDDQSEEEFQRAIAEERARAFRITVTVAGSDQQDLFGYGTEVFESPSMPDEITSIYLSNEAAYQGVTGRRPINRFSVTLDFSTPPLVDNNSPVSNPTPNFSNIAIEGERDAWSASIQEAAMGIFSRRGNGRKFLHAAFVYDIGLMLFALPAGLYACWRFSGFIQNHLGVYSGFLSAVAFIYIVLFCLWIYRVLYGYAKWAFPTVELVEAKSRSKRHRRFWYAIMTSLIAGLILDLSLALFRSS